MNEIHMNEIPATILLYDQDAYATEFSAKVISCEEIKRKKDILYDVILDQTLFFPEEGGQSPDRGCLSGREVVDVQIKKGIIRHTLKGPIAPGDQVSGKIDWKHRFYNMQQHSGEHIFSGLVHKKFGYDNVGFHLSDQIVTMDFNGILSKEDVKTIETEVNEVIIRNVPVLVSYPSEEELKNLEYRSKIEIEGRVRIVTVTGYDVCACCAPHVRRTGEIGLLKVMSLQNYKGGVRISILCGFRALEAFREKAAVISSIMDTLTTGQDQIADQVVKMKAANQSLSLQLAQAKQQLMDRKLASVPKDRKDVILFEQELDTQTARNAVNTLVQQHEGICAVFTGDDQKGYSFILASQSRDCREIAAMLRTRFACRGGGSNAMIQGSLKAAASEIGKALAESSEN